MDPFESVEGGQAFTANVRLKAVRAKIRAAQAGAAVYFASTDGRVSEHTTDMGAACTAC